MEGTPPTEEQELRRAVEGFRAKRRELQARQSRQGVRLSKTAVGTGKTYKPNGAREVARRQARLAAAA